MMEALLYYGFFAALFITTIVLVIVTFALIIKWIFRR